jgi:hypothetical protein
VICLGNTVIYSWEKTLRGLTGHVAECSLEALHVIERKVSSPDFSAIIKFTDKTPNWEAESRSSCEWDSKVVFSGFAEMRQWDTLEPAESTESTIYFYSPRRCYVSQVMSFLKLSSYKLRMCHSHLVLHVASISYLFISALQRYAVRSIYYEIVIHKLHKL